MKDTLVNLVSDKVNKHNNLKISIFSFTLYIIGTTTDATVCKIDKCKNCQQFCIAVNSTLECSCSDGYILQATGSCLPKPGFDTSKCVSTNSSYSQIIPFINKNEKCQCVENYIFDKKAKICIPDTNLAKLFKCKKPIVEVKFDQLPGCLCDPGQVFNAKSRNCDQKCDFQAVQNCAKNHNADCHFFDNKAKCVCKKNQIAYFSSENNTSFKCIDKCTTFLQLLENQNFQCTNEFSFCEHSSFEFDFQTKNSGYFIKNRSQLMSNKHCQCEMGFEKNVTTGQCNLAQQPIRYVKEVNFIGNSKNAFKVSFDIFGTILKLIIFI